MIEFKMFDGRVACVDPTHIVALVQATPEETREFGSKSHIYLPNGGPLSSKETYASLKKQLDAALK